MRLRCAFTLTVILFATQSILADTPAQSSTTAIAAASTERSQPIVDLVISATGDLPGRALSREGLAEAGVRLSLMDNHRVIETVTSDAGGYFVFRDVEPGLKVVRANRMIQPIRVWQQGIAPPSAKAGLLFVSGALVVRAQSCSTGAGCVGCDACCGGGFQGHFGGVFQHMLRNPWLVGAGTAAAIAIPLATDDDDEQDDDFASLPIGS